MKKLILPCIAVMVAMASITATASAQQPPSFFDTSLNEFCYGTSVGHCSLENISARTDLRGPGIQQACNYELSVRLAENAGWIVPINETGGWECWGIQACLLPAESGGGPEEWPLAVETTTGENEFEGVMEICTHDAPNTPPYRTLIPITVTEDDGDIHIEGGAPHVGMPTKTLSFELNATDTDIDIQPAE